MQRRVGNASSPGLEPCWQCGQALSLGGNASTGGASFVLLPGLEPCWQCSQAPSFGRDASTGWKLGGNASTGGVSFVLLPGLEPCWQCGQAPSFGRDASTGRKLGGNASTSGASVVSFILLPRLSGFVSTAGRASFILLPGCKQFCMHAQAIVTYGAFVFLGDWVCLVVWKGRCLLLCDLFCCLPSSDLGCVLEGGPFVCFTSNGSCFRSSELCWLLCCVGAASDRRGFVVNVLLCVALGRWTA